MGKQKNQDKALLFYRTVEIAALFLDICKNTPISEETERGTMDRYTENFIKKINLPKGIDKDKVLELIRNFNNTDKNIKGLNELQIAYQISSKVNSEKRTKLNSVNQLETIFSKLDLRDTEYDQVEPNFSLKVKYYNPIPLNSEPIEEAIFPSDKVRDNKQLREIIIKSLKDFEDNCIKISNNMTYNSWINIINTLLFCYTFNIPSSFSKKNCTVSLYNHLRTISAIARSLVEYNHINSPKNEKNGNEEQKYMIISGDVNGIQDFIFKTRFHAKARKGSAARLRGKSFYIELLTETIVDYILNSFNLGVNSVLSTSSGNFRILAPNTEINRKKIKDISNEISVQLFKEFNLSLGLTIIWTPISSNDLEDYSRLVKKINMNLEESKYTKKRELLFEDNSNITSEKTIEFFEPSEVSLNKKKCSVCEGEIEISVDKDVCSTCRTHEKIGKKLPRTKFIVKIEKDVYDKLKPIDCFNLFILNSVYLFISNEEKLSILKQIPEYTIYFSHFSFFVKSYTGNQSIKFFNFALPIPEFQGKLLSFDHLAGASFGIKRLGIVKADVDNLGKIISIGLIKDNNKYDEINPISRLRELSMRLDLFFGRYVSTISKKPQYRLWYNISCDKHKQYFTKFNITSKEGDNITLYRYNIEADKNNEVARCKKCISDVNYTTAIYGLFSGGDDFVFIGPWDLIIDFAIDVNSQFNNYISGNPWITMSAGIELSETNYPISLALLKARQFLEESKDFFKSKVKSKESIPLKNSVTIFGETLLWERKDKIYLTHKNDKTLGDFQNLLFQAKKIGKEIYGIDCYKEKQSPISRHFIHNLLSIWEQTFMGMTKEEVQERRTTQLECYPLLSYQIYRRYKEENYQFRKQKFDFFKKILPWMKFPATWIIYRYKEKVRE